MNWAQKLHRGFFTHMNTNNRMKRVSNVCHGPGFHQSLRDKCWNVELWDTWLTVINDQCLPPLPPHEACWNVTWLIQTIVQVARRVSNKNRTTQMVRYWNDTWPFPMDTYFCWLLSAIKFGGGDIMHYISIQYLFYCTDNTQRWPVVCRCFHYPVTCLLIGTAKYMTLWKKVFKAVFGLLV